MSNNASAVLTSTIVKYNHLITTQPHNIHRVFISDLHLSDTEPALVQAFLALLEDLTSLPNLQEFYILGDWFDVWIGDDAYLKLSATQKNQHWLTPIIEKLQQLTHNGCQVLVMHGNRDFLVGQPFCDTFAGHLVFEPYFIQINTQTFRLEHGDALCTDDKSYQRLRFFMRNRFIQWFLLKKPLKKRMEIANTIKQKSKKDKANKSLQIMDVNTKAVKKALNNVNALLHGHTHRPNIDQVKNNKIRYVLGDWRVINPNTSSQQIEAVIGITVKSSVTNKDKNNNPKANEEFKLCLFKV